MMYLSNAHAYSYFSVVRQKAIYLAYKLYQLVLYLDTRNFANTISELIEIHELKTPIAFKTSGL
jgi:hypothetical protein